MSDGPRYSLDAARTIAQSILEAIPKVAIDRAEIVGSIRRQSPTVGDIEILCVPEWDTDLLGKVSGSAMDLVWHDWTSRGRVLPGRCNGAKVKAGFIPRKGQPAIPFELYMTTPDSWGYMLAIRTGPATYSKALVTPEAHGGLLAPGYQCRDGGVFHNGVPAKVPTEREFLAIAGGWVEPSERGRQAVEDRRIVSNTRGESHKAFQPHAGGIARKIVEALETEPATCEELEKRLALKHQTASASLTGLLKANRVKVIGERLNESGRRARVYAAAMEASQWQ